LYTNTSGAQNVLSPSQYTIALNSPAIGSLWGVGGSVTYSSGSPIPAGTSLTITRTLPLQQLTTLSDQGDFNPQVIEQALDTLEMQLQQVSARGGAYRGIWASGVVYNFGDIVQDGSNGANTNNIYVCALANTSGTWATDLAAGDWVLVFTASTLSGPYLPLAGGVISGNLTVSGILAAANPALTGTSSGLSIGGNAATATTATTATNQSGGTISATSFNGGQLAGLRNRTINGDMRVDQRNAGASQTITAAASAAYTVDRFSAPCTGANVSGVQIGDAIPDQYAYQFTGAASVTAIAFGQRYESTNVYDLASTTATFSVKLSNSLLTTVTWTAYYPGSTDNWGSRTSIATGTFTVTSTLTKYSANIALGRT